MLCGCFSAAETARITPPLMPPCSALRPARSLRSHRGPASARRIDLAAVCSRARISAHRSHQPASKDPPRITQIPRWRHLRCLRETLSPDACSPSSQATDVVFPLVMLIRAQIKPRKTRAQSRNQRSTNRLLAWQTSGLRRSASAQAPHLGTVSFL